MASRCSTTESGAPASFEKLPIYWESKERPPLRDIYRDLIRLRRAHDAFTGDEVIWLENSRPADVVTLLRPGRNEEFLVAINFSNRPLETTDEIEHAGRFQPVRMAGVEEGPAVRPPRLPLGGFEWRIYRRSR